MYNRLKKCIALVMVFAMTISFFSISFAAVSISEDAYVTKAEFDEMMVDYNERLSKFEDNLDEKIDTLLSYYRPIGSIETSSDPNFNPNGVLSGIWEEITGTYVVESSFDTTTKQGYRLYANGWCEQWGVNKDLGSTTGVVEYSVTLDKPYVDTKYLVLFTPRTSGSLAAGDTWALSGKTTTGFTGKRSRNNVRYLDWYTAGMTSATSGVKVWKRVK